MNDTSESTTPPAITRREDLSVIGDKSTHKGKAGRDSTAEERAAVPVELSTGESLDTGLARTGTDPAILAASTIHELTPAQHLGELAKELGKRAAAVKEGDMSRPENMLLAQAHTLDALFHTMATQSHRNMKAGYLDAAETYMRLALKAQSNARATLETLSEIKNPRQSVFAKQANITNGPQQVNNGSPRAWDIEKPSNEQSARSENELPANGRTSALPGPADSPMAPVGVLDGAKNRRGKVPVSEKCD